MDLTRLGDSRRVPRALIAGGEGDDDLRSYWSGFMTDYIVDVRVGGGVVHTCVICVSMSSLPNPATLSPLGLKGIYVYAPEFETADVPPVGDWYSEFRALGIGVPEEVQVHGDLSLEVEDIIGDLLSETSDGRDEVWELGDVGDILRFLRRRGLHDMAGDLEYKKSVIEEDPDDLPISFESAREFASFVEAETFDGSPNVTVDPYGYVGLEWTIPDPTASWAEEEAAKIDRRDDRVWGRGDGVLGLWFLPDGLVRVCGTSGPVGQGVERMLVNSIMPSTHVMGAITPFLSRLHGA